MTREEAIEELQYIKDSLVSCELSYDALDMAIESLSADVRENVKGEWIIHNSYGREYLECPHCRTYFLHEYLVRNSYCPNCGAEMRPRTEKIYVPKEDFEVEE